MSATQQLLVKISADIADLKKKTEEAKSTLGGFGDAAKKVGAAVGVAFGARQVVNLFRTTITDAANAEKEVFRLTNALRAQGITSTKVRDEILKFSDAMQQQTTFDDDAITSAQSLLVSLGRLSGQGLKNATRATLDLASGLGIDLRSAALLVGKAAAGDISTLSRYGLIIHSTGDKAKDFAQVLQQVQARFGGAAEAIAQGAGAFDQVKNAVGDLSKAIGSVFLPELETAAHKWAQWIGSLSDGVKRIDEIANPTKELEAQVDALRTILDATAPATTRVSDDLNSMKDALNGVTPPTDSVGEGFVEMHKRIEAGHGGRVHFREDISAMTEEQIKHIAALAGVSVAQVKAAASDGKARDALARLKATLEETLVQRLKLDGTKPAPPAVSPDAAPAVHALAVAMAEIEAGGNPLQRQLNLDKLALDEFLAKAKDLAKQGKGPSPQMIAEYQRLHDKIEADKQAIDSFDARLKIMAKGSGATAYAAMIGKLVDGLDTLSHEGEAEPTKELTKDQENYNAAVDAGASALSGLFTNLATGQENASQAFQDAAKSMMTTLLDLAIKQIVTDAFVAQAGSTAHDAPAMGPGALITGAAVGAAVLALISSLPKAHDGMVVGGAPGRDPTPVMVERGEEILSRRDPRNVLNGGGLRPSRIVNVTVRPTFAAVPSRSEARKWMRDSMIPELKRAEALG